MSLTANLGHLSLASVLLCSVPGVGAASPPAPAVPAAAPAAMPPDPAPAPAPKAKPAQPRATLTVPLYAEEHAATPVAKVGSDVITLQELVDALTSSHEERSGTTHASAEFLPLLERMIELRLVLLDARETGIDATPEVQGTVNAFADSTLMSMLRSEISKGTKPDPEEVERLFRERAREWKLRSLLFKVEQDAKDLVAAVAAGKSFDELAKKAVEDKKATGAPEGEYLPRDVMVPAIERTVAGLEKGGVGGPLAVKGGFAVLNVEDIRYPENPQLRERAEAESRALRESAAVWKAYVELQKKHVKKVDRALLQRIDFHAAKPGIPALRKDKRVLVAFRDPAEKPITVSDITAGVEGKFFHGMDLAIKEKRVNEHKDKLFDTLLMKRVLMKEARARGIHERFAYKSRVEQYENSVVFGRFVETAIRPSVRVDESEVKAYYAEHQKEFTDPELMTLDSIAFPDAKKAQVALDKLRAGADFAWMSTNGEGVVAEAEQDQELKGRTVTVESMPPALAKALAGAREGELRLYSAPGGLYYVIRVARHLPSSIRPVEKVKSEILKKLFNENLSKAVKDWAAKVRESTDVEIYISRLEH